MATATKKAAAPAKKAVAKKAAAPAAKKAATGPDLGRHDLKPFGIEAEVVKFRDTDEMKWDEIADKLSTTTGKVLMAYGNAKIGNKRLKGTPEERSAHVVRLRDEEDMSWGQVMIVTGLNEGYVRSRYTELTGTDTRGLNLGRGGRRPLDWAGEVNGSAPAKKAVASKKAAAPKAPPKTKKESTGKVGVGDLDLDGLKERLEGAAVMIQRGDKTETIQVSKVQGLKSGAVTVSTHPNGSSRTFKVADISKVGRKRAAA